MLKTLRKLARRSGFLHPWLRRTYRAYLYHSARLAGRLRQNELRPLWIDPHLVTHTVALDDATLKGNATWHFGAVSDGDWDEGGAPVREYNQVYPIAFQRFVEGQSYEQIPEFQAHLERISRGEFLDGCETSAQYLHRWEQLEQLFHRIRAEGYKSQRDLGSDNPLDEIRVQIGRRGQFLLEEGLHRLVIAQILNLPEIPVIVTRRHSEWDKLRQAVIRILVQRGFIHQPFNHPDLDSLPAIYGHENWDSSMYGHERWDFIVQSLPLRQGTALDIGAYFGYFSHRLEDAGFECYAVEPDEENLEVLCQYRKIMGKTFTVWKQSIFEIYRTDFDIVMALNIFHHLTKRKRDYERLTAFLQQLRCRAMYFEPAYVPDAYRSFDDDAFVEFVLQHVPTLNQARLLGHTREGRNLYLLLP